MIGSGKDIGPFIRKLVEAWLSGVVYLDANGVVTMAKSSLPIVRASKETLALVEAFARLAERPASQRSHTENLYILAFEEIVWGK